MTLLRLLRGIANEDGVGVFRPLSLSPPLAQWMRLPGTRLRADRLLHSTDYPHLIEMEPVAYRW